MRTSPAHESRRSITALVVSGCLVLVFGLESLLRQVPAYRAMFESWGFAAPRSLRSLVEIGVVLVAVCGLRRMNPVRGLEELGFRAPVGRALGFAGLATAPMVLVFLFAYPLATEVKGLEVFYLALLSPVAEETVYRGFAVGQLWRRAGWPLPLAVALPALLFGYGHLDGSASLAANLGLFALTAAGAVAFAWLFARWRTLLAPIGLHVLMNLCWNVWQVGESALAGWVPFALQVAVVGLAIALTLRWTPPAESIVPPAAA